MQRAPPAARAAENCARVKNRSSPCLAVMPAPDRSHEGCKALPHLRQFFGVQDRPALAVRGVRRGAQMA